ncbi:Phage baseplate-like protein [Laribacter hongkongensis HLHK9]|uniref:Phage baseplate-like protein n=1 Tax=Laribacter hongkongensis (strain HLHK9) TaxID=557598 RepID=C1D853_LARHH|nr:phage baseplate assembly protein V [Laribacter hongkongensis]ACO74643.1 Phage baseplate-like protein [Laribacter hongkongensis HLHK9]
MTDKSQAALIKSGIVARHAGAGHVVVRFDDLDGMESAPWPVVGARYHKDKGSHPPDIGAQVACVCDEHAENGFVLGEIPSDADAPGTDNPALWHWNMRDGSVFSFDPETGRLEITLTGDAVIKGPSLMLDVAETTCTGKMTVKGLFTYQSGMAGSGGSAGTKISGTIQHDGGALTSNGITLHTHTHTE